MIVAFRLPKRPARSADAYLRFIPRTEMDIAVVGAAVNVTLDQSGKCTEAMVVLGAVAPTAVIVPAAAEALIGNRTEEHTSELQSLMRISYAVFCSTKQNSYTDDIDEQK